jgi:hypothetical protein
MHPLPQQQEAFVGPTRTLPPDHQPPPRARRQRVGDSLELDRPPAAPPELIAPPEHSPDRAVAINGREEHLDVTLEPLGRRTPPPLEASREAVER